MADAVPPQPPQLFYHEQQPQQQFAATTTTTTTAISAILEPLLLVLSALASLVRAVPWAAIASRLAALAALPWRIALVPVSFLAGVLHALLAPVIHLVAFTWGLVQSVLGFLASLEPLYTFFAVAAIVGIAAGFTLSFFSRLLTRHLRLEGSDQAPLPDWPLRTVSPRHYRKGHLKAEADGSSGTSSESEWGWVDTTTSTSPTRWRPVSGLLSQTIHEETDSDDIF
ncbi:hypothetical protein N3K66_006610 [Trichothecium roseum]|uniref:Uncharacterized protein n=1 Tax=Trichothecium roseum TaxID=47278 RepID=A0ACC0UVS4_9HYPO|nr:hypothetical protein N3K66_006610 [Trichothecium roseum]